MSDSEDMTEFASIVERIERGEVSLIRMIYGPPDSSGLSVSVRRATPRRAGLQGCQGMERDADQPSTLPNLCSILIILVPTLSIQTSYTILAL